MARSAVARATCAAGARRDRLSRKSVIRSSSLNARSGSFCRLDIGHLPTRHVTNMADLVPNDPLVAQEHDVTLFASGDSQTAAKLVPCVPQGLRLAGIRDHIASHLVMLNTVRRRADEFDIIHFHLDLLQYPLFQDLAHKCVTTLHGRLDLPDFQPVYHAFPHMPLVSISDDQRRPMPPHVNWLATVYHGLPSSVCPYHQRGGDYLAFLGRIAPEKRPDRAIEIAKRAGVPLKIAAKVDKAD